MKKKVLAILLAVALVATLLAGCGGEKKPEAPAPAPAPAPQQKFINLATGGTAGTYYPLGAAFADIWNKNIKGVNATAQSTGASVANVNLLRENKAEVIFVQNDIAFYAANGVELFKEGFQDLRGLATLYPETVQIITRADKKINTIADLKGKKVAVGAQGSGTEANARQILEMAGITYKDLTPQYLSFGDAANNLKDGNIDAAFITAGFPTAAVQDIAAQHKIKVVPVENDLADKIIAKYPYYTKVNIPAGTYTGEDKDVKAVAVMAMLAVSSKLDEATAYEMVKTMYANSERIKAAHKVGAMITPESGKNGMPIKLHPGAEKFFNEKK